MNIAQIAALPETLITFRTLGQPYFQADQGGVNQVVMVGMEQPLTLDGFKEVVYEDAMVIVSPESISNFRDPVSGIDQDAKAVYGVETGFGILRDKRVSPADLRQLQRNIITSHDVNIGGYLPGEVVRGMALVRLSALAQGHSGVSPATLATLEKVINAGILPIIRRFGSVGASGDLAPLSALARVLVGDPRTKVLYAGEVIDAQRALEKANIQPANLGPKEGLALTNGTSLMASYLALNLINLFTLFKQSLITNNMVFEALLGTSDALEPELHQLRKQHGQQIVAAVQGELLNSGHGLYTNNLTNVQDNYSLRCTPQIFGPVWDKFLSACEVGSRELNAVTDNPIFLNSTGNWTSGGNFHGMVLALEMDTLAIAIPALANLFACQASYLTDSNHSKELTPCLVDPDANPGLESSHMIPPYGIAALAANIRQLAAPASVHNIPTCGGAEDIVSMGPNAGLELWQSIDNCFDLLTMHTALVVQALYVRQSIIERKLKGSSPDLGDLQNDPVYSYLLAKKDVREQLAQGKMPDLSFTPATQAAYAFILRLIDGPELPLKHDEDAGFSWLYEKLGPYIRSGEIIKVVEKALNPG